jgi:hypothetical protein
MHARALARRKYDYIKFAHDELVGFKKFKQKRQPVAALIKAHYVPNYINLMN